MRDDLPLAGIRVLDLSRLLPGPYCTLLLADMGAEVIKIEMPRMGDFARVAPAELGGDAMFQAMNRNKQSVALDFRHPEGLRLLLRLAHSADVLVETFRPGAAKRWGFGYEAVHAVNPRSVYCSLTGYGQSGPMAHRAGHDLNYIAIAGLLAFNGPPGGAPLPPGVQIADLAGGMLAAIAILGALVGRARHDQGAYLDVAMLDSVISWLAPVAGALYQRTGQVPLPGSTPLLGSAPCYRVYAAADGKFFTVCALEPHFWSAFCQTLGRPELFARQYDPALGDELRDLFLTRPRAEWLALFAPADACVEPVNDLAEALNHPQVRARGLVIEHPAAPPSFGPPFQSAAGDAGPDAARLGQHTAEVLERWGLPPAEITELAAAGIIALDTPPAGQ